MLKIAVIAKPGSETFEFINSLPYKVVRLDSHEELKRKRNIKLVILAHYMTIIPKEYTDKYNIINIHPSLLPSYRGADPVEQQMMNPDDNSNKFGVTIHRVDAGVDTGEVLAQDSYNAGDLDTVEDIYNKLRLMSFDLLDMVIKREIGNIITKKIYFIGESGVGKSYIRSICENVFGIKTFDTPVFKIMDAELGDVQIQFMQEIKYIQEHTSKSTQGCIIEGDPVSTIAFTKLAFSKEYISREDAEKVAAKFAELDLNGYKYIVLKRDRDTIQKYREERNRETEYHSQFSDEDVKYFNDLITPVSVDYLRMANMNFATFTLGEHITEENVLDLILKEML